MENPAQTVLEENLKIIRECNMDPGTLAVALLSAGIIDGDDEERASMKGELASDKRKALVRSVMRNGAPQVFQQFAQIFLDQRSTKWLGGKLKEDFIKAGGKWVMPAHGPTPGPNPGISPKPGLVVENQDYPADENPGHPVFAKKPTMALLRRMEWKEGETHHTLQVVAMAARRWRDVGSVGLGMEEFTLDNLEDIKGDNEKSFCALMSRFLVNGSPEYDRPTWGSVIEALEKAKLREISKQLRKALFYRSAD